MRVQYFPFPDVELYIGSGVVKKQANTLKVMPTCALMINAKSCSATTTDVKIMWLIKVGSLCPSVVLNLSKNEGGTPTLGTK